MFPSLELLLPLRLLQSGARCLRLRFAFLPVRLFTFGGPSPFGLRFDVTARPPIRVGNLFQVVIRALVAPEKMESAFSVPDNCFVIIEWMDDDRGVMAFCEHTGMLMITPSTCSCENVTDIIEVIALKSVVRAMLMNVCGQEAQYITLDSVVVLPCERACHAME